MSSEIEAAGAVVTAGLAAAAIEKHGKQAEAHGPCANCGAALDGAFCAACGQPAHIHRTLGHLIEEIIHGVLHFDARAWRTLPLLTFRPGTLTRNYIHGQRARYISPLALFLFVVFGMFFAMSLIGSSGDNPPPAAVAAETGETTSVVSDVGGLDAIYDEIAKQANSGEIYINTGFKELDKKIIEKLKNPEFAIYKIQNTAYKFSFLIVPISLPFMWLLFFWKRGVTLFDHAVVILYSLCFVSILFILLIVLSLFPGGVAWPALQAMSFAFPVHLYFQLKGAYKLGWFSALWRTLILLIFCMFTVLIFLIAILALGVM